MAEEIKSGKELLPYYSLEKSATETIYLHSFKNCNDNCYGILVGNISPDGAVITKSIPLSHGEITIPTLLLGLELIKTYLTKTNQQIIGAYEVLTHKCTREYSDVIEYIIRTVAQDGHMPQALLLAVEIDPAAVDAAKQTGDFCFIVNP